LPPPPPAALLDIPHYLKLLLRAAATIFWPLGISEQMLNERYLSQARQLPLFE